MHPDIIRLFTRAPTCRTTPPEGHQWSPPPLMFVMPYCERDAHLLVQMLEWAVELRGKPVDRTAVFVTDSTTSAIAHQSVEQAAKGAFTQFHTEFIHTSTKGIPWPGCNNVVFSQTAKLIVERGWQSPWFWLETDMVPTRADWVEALESEYALARKPFMGAWVEYYDIFNGAMVYPPNLVEWGPAFFASNVAKAAAFDCALAPEMVWFGHNAAHLMPHIWCNRANGRPGGFNGGPPEWTPRLVEWVVNHNTVLVHRCKDDKLISILRAKLFDSKTDQGNLEAHPN